MDGERFENRIFAFTNENGNVWRGPYLPQGNRSLARPWPLEPSVGTRPLDPLTVLAEVSRAQVQPS